MKRILLPIALYFSVVPHAHSFAHHPNVATTYPQNDSPVSTRSTSFALHAVSKTIRGDKFRREKILNPPNRSRDGNNFKMERFKGTISFGYTADLITSLPVPHSQVKTNVIQKWLSNAERVAFAIWDEQLITEIRSQIYRLQLITLKFITIQLKPTVDVQMWTEMETDTHGNEQIVFFLESMDFDPNVQILPGVKFTAESLGIQIDVAGEMRVSSDKQGLTGKIGFVTSGKLPPPLRILPEVALKSAAGVINKQIADFAVKSFEKGATKEFRKFLTLEESKEE